MRDTFSESGYRHCESKSELRESSKTCQLCALMLKSLLWKHTKLQGPIRIFAVEHDLEKQDGLKKLDVEHPFRRASLLGFQVLDSTVSRPPERLCKLFAYSEDSK